GSNLWEAIGSDLDESADFTCTPPVIRFKFDVPPELFRLRKATRELMSLLETAPAAALKLPKHAGASIAGMTIGANADTNHQPRLVIDIDHEIAILDGTPFPVGRSGALFLDALHKAGGLWRSSTELGRTISELEGTRFDRLRDKLPRPLKALIDADKGKGYRIPPE